jgi:hypothetical protein
MSDKTRINEKLLVSFMHWTRLISYLTEHSRHVQNEILE